MRKGGKLMPITTMMPRHEAAVLKSIWMAYKDEVNTKLQGWCVEETYTSKNLIYNIGITREQVHDAIPKSARSTSVKKGKGLRTDH